MKKEIKEERKRLQTELRAKIKKSSSNRCVPEIEHLIDKPHVFELPEHTVTITSISDNQYRDENIFLGINTVSAFFHSIESLRYVIAIVSLAYFRLTSRLQMKKLRPWQKRRRRLKTSTGKL